MRTHSVTPSRELSTSFLPVLKIVLILRKRAPRLIQVKHISFALRGTREWGSRSFSAGSMFFTWYVVPTSQHSDWKGGARRHAVSFSPHPVQWPPLTLPQSSFCFDLTRTRDWRPKPGKTQQPESKECVGRDGGHGVLPIQSESADSPICGSYTNILTLTREALLR